MPRRKYVDGDDDNNVDDDDVSDDRTQLFE